MLICVQAVNAKEHPKFIIMENFWLLLRATKSILEAMPPPNFSKVVYAPAGAMLCDNLKILAGIPSAIRLETSSEPYMQVCQRGGWALFCVFLHC